MQPDHLNAEVSEEAVGQLTVEDVEVRGALFDSDWEILSLEVETPEESVTVFPEHVVIGERERRNNAEAALNSVQAEERERLRGEDARLAAFERLTEGNFFRFTDPEGQEEYVWQVVDAVLDAALDVGLLPAESEPQPPQGEDA